MTLIAILLLAAEAVLIVGLAMVVWSQRMMTDAQRALIDEQRKTLAVYERRERSLMGLSTTTTNAQEYGNQICST